MQIGQIGFFAPIQGKHHPKEALHWLGKAVQWYFDFGQNAFKISEDVRLKDRFIPVAMVRNKQNAFWLACKVVFVVMSWFTLIAPFVMITSLGIYRYFNRFILINKMGVQQNLQYKKLSEVARSEPSLEIEKYHTDLLQSIFSEERVLERIQKNKTDLASLSKTENFGSIETIEILDFLAYNFNQKELLDRFLRKLKKKPPYLQEAIDELLKVREDFRQIIIADLESTGSKLHEFLRSSELNLVSALNSKENFSDLTLTRDYVKAIEILKVIAEKDIKKYFNEETYQGIMSVIEPRGIKNLGNSCYMNSGLQVLIGIPFLRDLIVNPWTFRLDSRNEKEQRTDQRMFYETVEKYKPIKNLFQEFLNAYLEKKELVAPAKRFRDALFDAKLIDGKELMQDAEIFFRGLISATGYFVPSRRYLLPPDNSYNKNTRRFPEDRHAFQTVCMKSGTGIFLGHSFQEIINKEFSSKNLCDDDPNKQKFGYCKEVFKYEEAAEYLILAVNRFGNNLQKYNEEIFFDDGEVIDFSCAMSQDVIINHPDEKFLYEPIAIIQHHGQSMQDGHFTADIKKSGIWFHCSDSQIKRVGAVNPNLGNGYIFCFRKLPSHKSTT